MPIIGFVAALGLATRRSAFSEETAGSTVMACLRRATRRTGSRHWPAEAARHQHLERELGERSGRHDQQVLVADQVLDLAEQSLVERVGAGEIKRQRRVALGGLVRARCLKRLCTLGCAARPPMRPHRARSAAPPPRVSVPACRGPSAPSACRSW